MKVATNSLLPILVAGLALATASATEAGRTRGGAAEYRATLYDTSRCALAGPTRDEFERCRVVEKASVVSSTRSAGHYDLESEERGATYGLRVHVVVGRDGTERANVTYAPERDERARAFDIDVRLGADDAERVARPHPGEVLVFSRR